MEKKSNVIISYSAVASYFNINNNLLCKKKNKYNLSHICFLVAISVIKFKTTGLNLRCNFLIDFSKNVLILFP